MDSLSVSDWPLPGSGSLRAWGPAGLLAVALLVSASTGCDSSTSYVPDPFSNIIFPGTEEIQTASPGEQCIVGGRPYFVWDATGGLVYVGVFDENIDVNQGRIQNTGANVWAWHSGMGRGVEGVIQFDDGRAVVDGVIQEDSLPTPLEQGRSYYWAVWAWNSAGTRVTHSSAAIYFTVDSTRIGCPTP